MRSRFFSSFIVAIRLSLGFVMFIAGMSKLFHDDFPGLFSPVWLTEELSKYGLEYLGEFIAWSQVVTGLLLMTQRFATLGAIFLMPLLLNIFMVTLSLGIHFYQRGTLNLALNTSAIVAAFLVLNILLLLYDYHKLKFVFCEGDDYLRTRKIWRKNSLADSLVIFGIGLVLAAPFLFSINKLYAYLMVIAGIAICSLPLFQKKRKRTMEGAINS